MGDAGRPPPAAGGLIALGGLALIGVITLAYHRRILRLVDRHFFPDQHRMERRLASMETEIEAAPSVPELAGAIRSALEGVLGYAKGFLLLYDEDRSVLRPARGEARPLPLEARTVARLMEGGAFSVATGSDRQASDWAEDAGIESVVPVRSPDGELLGAAAVGQKSSGLPVHADDEARVHRVAAAAALTLDALSRIDDSASRISAATPVAAGECEGCGSAMPLAHRVCEECGSRLIALNLPFLVGGRYRLIRRAGAGGMGMVFEAWDEDLARSVALKTLPMTSAKPAARLRREARFMGRLNHPNLAVIHAFEMWRGTPILVIEFMRSGTLRDRLERESLSVKEALHVGVSLAHGVRYLHGQHLLHGDVKPSNVGIAESGQVKLLDFGITRVLPTGRPGVPGSGRSVSGASNLDADASSAPFGTPLYLPPEVLRGESEPGIDSDLWALSLTLYEAIAGGNPMRARNAAATLARIIRETVPDLRTTVPHCPQEVAEFFERALGRAPSGRPGSAQQLIEELEELRRRPYAV